MVVWELIADLAHEHPDGLTESNGGLADRGFGHGKHEDANAMRSREHPIDSDGWTRPWLWGGRVGQPSEQVLRDPLEPAIRQRPAR